MSVSSDRESALATGVSLWTPDERESFFAAIERHRRAAWQVSAVSFLGIGVLALILAWLTAPLFYAVIDWRGWDRWAFPLVVIGMNSIAAYCIAHLVVEEFTVSSFKTHLGANVFQIAGETYAPFLQGLVVLTVYWLILFWMYRRSLFLRI